MFYLNTFAMKCRVIVLCLFVLYSASCAKGPKPGEESENTQPAPVIELTPGEARVASSGNSIAFKLLGMIEEEGNFMISPLSLNFAMAMAWNGAAGNTAGQIQKALGFPQESPFDVNLYFKKLSAALPSADPASLLFIANSVWYKSDFPVKEGFLQINKQWFNALVTPLDFSKEQESLKAINEWCSKNTDKKIDKILDQIKPNEVMFLVNALYFKAPWKTKFDPKSTLPLKFNLDGGGSVDVPAMHKRFMVEYNKGEKYRAVTLPFGNGAFKMTIILPGEELGVADLYAELATAGAWENITQKSDSAQLGIYLPKFKFSTTLEFNDKLKMLGITDAFDGNANFSNIADYPQGDLRISKVLQKTVIEINEEGGEAAAVTSVGFDLTSVNPDRDFRANKPFLFVIWEQSTGTILFTGKVANPLN